MTTPVTLIGSPVSPYVRKVLAACAVKGVAVEIDPVSPMVTKPEFRTLSPLRRIPVWIEGDVTLCDSSIIVQYIEETRPGPSLWPADPAERARARYIEEFADTRLFDVLGWRLFFQIGLKPIFFGEAGDEDVIRQSRETDAPEIFNYLESLTPEDGFLFGALSLADLSLAPAFFNARAVGVAPEPGRWPRLAAWLDRMEAETPLGDLNRLAGKLMRTPLHAHRARLEQFGLVPSSTHDWSGETATRGPMTPV